MGTLNKSNVALTTFLTFMIGFFLSSLYLIVFAFTQHFIMASKTSSMIIFGTMIATGGIFSMVITIVGDKIHYMNRDIKTYVYVSEAIIMGFIFLSFIILMFLTRSI